jgi:hypothetical protein
MALKINKLDCETLGYRDVKRTKKIGGENPAEKVPRQKLGSLIR